MQERVNTLRKKNYGFECKKLRSSAIYEFEQFRENFSKLSSFTDLQLAKK